MGALCARAAVIGAFMNVRINAAGYDDQTFVQDIVARGASIQQRAMALEASILEDVNAKIGV